MSNTNNKTLPIGIMNNSSAADWGVYDDSEHKLDEKYKKVKCECGVWTLYGKECPDTYHVDYCPLYVKKENKL